MQGYLVPLLDGLPSDNLKAKIDLKRASYVQTKSFYLLFSKIKWVWPLANSNGSTLVGLIFGNLISFSGATPISLTPLLIVYFSIPVAIPLSRMIASVLNAALAIPAKNFPL